MTGAKTNSECHNHPIMTYYVLWGRQIPGTIPPCMFLGRDGWMNVWSHCRDCHHKFMGSGHCPFCGSCNTEEEYFCDYRCRERVRPEG